MIVESDLLYVRYKPLHVYVSVLEKSGTVKQVHYADTETFVPNRRITPLYLQPVFYVIDPDGVIMKGDKVKELSSLRWYLGSVNAENEITTKESDPNSDYADYCKGLNGILVVRKNTDYLSPQILIFTGAFYDVRRGMEVYGEKTVLLSSTTNAEAEAVPCVVLDVPSSYRFNPLRKEGHFVINASMYRNGVKVESGKSKFWWYGVEGDMEHLLGSEILDLAYVQGQYTEQLVINLDYVQRLVLRCKGLFLRGTAPEVPPENVVVTETRIIRRIPGNVVFQINRYAGYRVKPTDRKIKRSAEVICRDGKVIRPGRYFSFRWLYNTNKAGAVDREVGRGTEIDLPVSYASLKSSIPATLKLDVTEHTEYRAVGDGEGNICVDKDGNIITGF